MKWVLGKLVQFFQTWKSNHEQRYNGDSSHQAEMRGVARLQGAITMSRTSRNITAVDEAPGQGSVNLQKRLQTALQQASARG